MLSTAYLIRDLKQVYVYSTLDEYCNTFGDFEDFMVRSHINFLKNISE
jgi:hypothetical protein